MEVLKHIFFVGTVSVLLAFCEGQTGTEEPVFFIAQGRKDCPAMGGAFIKDQEMCKAACTEFAYPQKEILGGFKCYKDHRGYCLQNGKNGGGASMLCEQIY